MKLLKVGITIIVQQHRHIVSIYVVNKDEIKQQTVQLIARPYVIHSIPNTNFHFLFPFFPNFVRTLGQNSESSGN